MNGLTEHEKAIWLATYGATYGSLSKTYVGMERAEVAAFRAEEAIENIRAVYSPDCGFNKPEWLKLGGESQ